MTVASTGPGDADDGVAPLFARADAARARDDRRLAHALADYALPYGDRLDDATRAALDALLAALVATVERELASHAGRMLGRAASAERLLRDAGDVLPRLRAAGLAQDRPLMAEIVARVRQDQLGERLPREAASEDRPSLLVRLADVRDGVIAAAARALLGAESRRRERATIGTELPAELHASLVWWVAAALRERVAGLDGSDAADRAITEAALRSLADHDESARLEAASTRLAIAIDARPDELGELLLDALADGRAALFIAALARAAGLDYEDARLIVLDPDGARLWLLLRAQSLDRATIARIGLALAEADARRDLDAFADQLDAIAAVPAQAARDAFIPDRLHPAFRAAVRALGRAEAR